MRWFEALAYALIAPAVQFIEFGDLVDLGQLAYGEWILSFTPMVYAIVAGGVLLGWGLVALLVRALPPTTKSPDSARLLRLLGLFLLWCGVAIALMLGNHVGSQAMSWMAAKIGLGVMLAFLVIVVADRLRRAR